jgi:eukaryotic-like serine/threonine-protein kinase
LIVRSAAPAPQSESEAQGAPAGIASIDQRKDNRGDLVEGDSDSAIQIAWRPMAKPRAKEPRMNSAARDLLFGLVALRVGFINQDNLVSVLEARARGKTGALADDLEKLGHLDTEQRESVEALVTLHLKKNGDDVEQSLAAVHPGSSTLVKLAGVGDPDIHATLTHLGSARTEPEDGGGVTPGVGTTSADGRRFRVLRPHAQGGLGAVYIALDEELHREVALKQILEQHADDTIARQRFLLEAEITGGLEHPGIVPVYGLGHHRDGRPYYAMRFIKGDSLKEAIAAFHVDPALKADRDARTLARQKLLRRFLDVCNAIDYAHGRGVLHRDLKPANIIVGRYGETLVVDWGLAKAVGAAELASDAENPPLLPPSASGSANTLPGIALGTPAYMSPEQASGDIGRLGPRSDVYSLGATLYCLLTGQAPFVSRDLLAVIQSVIKGEFPPPHSLDGTIPAALEAICLQAMATRPEDRYGSPRELADDIERWIADARVSAYRETVWERLGRWSRTHRTLVRAAAASLVVALIAAAAIAVLQSRAADRERKAHRAESAALVAEQKALKVARNRLEQLSRANDLLASIFLDLHPRAENNRQPLGALLGDRLDRAATQLDGEAVGDPVMVANLQGVLGNSLTNLGHYNKAIAVLSRALKTREAALGADDPSTFVVRANLAEAYRSAGRHAEAITMLEEILKRHEKVGGADNSDTLSARSNLAAAYASARRYDDAIALNREVLARRESKLGADHVHTLNSRNNLADLYRLAGRTAESIKIQEETLQVLEAKLGPDHPNTLTSRGNLAAAYSASGQHAKVVSMYESLIKKFDATVGSRHPLTVATRNNVAVLYHLFGRDGEAIPIFEAILKVLDAEVGPAHPTAVATRGNLAAAYLAVGRWEDSERLARYSLERRRKDDPNAKPDIATDLATVGTSLLRQGRPADAEPFLRESLEIFEKTMPEDSRRFVAEIFLGAAKLAQGKHAEAESPLVSGYERLASLSRKGRLPIVDRPVFRESADRIIQLYESWGRTDQAETWKARLGLRDLPANIFARP